MSREEHLRLFFEGIIGTGVEDFDRDGLKESFKRQSESWSHILSGYRFSDIAISGMLKTFQDSSSRDQIVLLSNIEMFSVCEHHFLPFYGVAHIAYIPRGDTILGVSKLARLLDVYAHRLQVQERIGNQVTEKLQEVINPVGCACIIEAVHLCMRMRGVEKQHSIMKTSSLKGVFRDEGTKGVSARNELMLLIYGSGSNNGRF